LVRILSESCTDRNFAKVTYIQLKVCLTTIERSANSSGETAV
jgi:hypothetical protein